VLVLTRRAGESIVIGDEVRVVVLDVRGDTVRLGIEAPRSVQVHRAEVYAEVQAANAAAVNRSDDLDSAAARLTRLARPKPRPPQGPERRDGGGRGARDGGRPGGAPEPGAEPSDGPTPQGGASSSTPSPASPASPGRMTAQPARPVPPRPGPPPVPPQAAARQTPSAAVAPGAGDGEQP
jgi:carbon storage regulator